ncbi:hypothetical protein DO021_15435 [Desulfobacter hydrogenophilus]|uniref:Uncharacterized protein n=1 Tax=Desulfobacter hydrogenophilus TaxID=2291 RepID=A0A328FBM8_9BACT|nr:hypothetical protein [Desulfobacter hydrogenophilus]NDY73074.1 hypothetical protein [Desulfobacter hydrogenophilus]QBH13576.1 hypothetical protein EYB58_11950 [Desulfobacter hydrogenophilus]RAM01080.1 hypothetical protein DO021_15435 [Desulfobacter hydrogenophilus]
MEKNNHWVVSILIIIITLNGLLFWNQHIDNQEIIAKMNQINTKIDLILDPPQPSSGIPVINSRQFINTVKKMGIKRNELEQMLQKIINEVYELE